MSQSLKVLHFETLRLLDIFLIYFAKKFQVTRKTSNGSGESRQYAAVSGIKLMKNGYSSLLEV